MTPHTETILDIYDDTITDLLGEHQGLDASWCVQAWPLAFRWGGIAWIVDNEDGTYSLTTRTFDDQDTIKTLWTQSADTTINWILQMTLEKYIGKEGVVPTLDRLGIAQMPVFDPTTYKPTTPIPPTAEALAAESTPPASCQACTETPATVPVTIDECGSTMICRSCADELGSDRSKAAFYCLPDDPRTPQEQG